MLILAKLNFKQDFFLPHGRKIQEELNSRPRGHLPHLHTSVFPPLYTSPVHCCRLYHSSYCSLDDCLDLSGCLLISAHLTLFSFLDLTDFSILSLPFCVLREARGGANSQPSFLMRRYCPFILTPGQ